MHSSRMRTSRSSSHLLEGGSDSVHAGIPPGVGLETPPVVSLETPPRWGPGDPQVWAWRPPRCGPGDPSPPDQTPQLPPWVWAWRPARHAGIPPAMHAGISSPPPP